MDKRNKLIEKLGVYLEHKEQLAPLAGRILSYLVLKGRKGETFENLVTQLNASKSTIFTHLTTLQASNRITYYTKSGDRKKYFILSPNAVINSMDEVIENWKQEKELHLEVVEYKKEINKDLPDESEQKFDLDFHEDYIQYLKQASEMMQKLRTKLINNHKNQ